MIKILIIISITILIILLCGYFGVGGYFYHFSLNPRFRKTILNKKKKKKKTNNNYLADDESIKWFEKESKYKEVYIKSKDKKINLHSYKIINKKSNNWVIIIHGYFGTGKELLNASKNFYERGFNILLPELRAHGKTGGKYIGMGWPDRLDIIEWIKYLNKHHKDNKIILYGVSMGAATVMMTSGENLPENVKIAIEDCGYTSVWEEFSHQLKTFFKLRPRLIMSAANIISKLKNNFILKDADSIKQIKKANIPMLFIHGSEDKFVPFDMMEKIYNAYPSQKEKLIIEGAKHAKASFVNPELYWSTIDNFIKKYF